MVLPRRGTLKVANAAEMHQGTRAPSFAIRSPSNGPCVSTVGVPTSLLSWEVHVCGVMDVPAGVDCVLLSLMPKELLTSMLPALSLRAAFLSSLPVKRS
jgi:hypothetical protein